MRARDSRGGEPGQGGDSSEHCEARLHGWQHRLCDTGLGGRAARPASIRRSVSARRMGGADARSSVGDVPFKKWNPSVFRGMDAKKLHNVEMWSKHRESYQYYFKPAKHAWGGFIFGLVIPVGIYFAIKSEMQAMDKKEERQREYM